MHHALLRLINHQRPHLVFALRGTVAVLAAVVAATFLKLENPYWAGMTALIVIQPTRGLLLEKSFYRLIGTAAGSLAGFWLLLATRDLFWTTIALSFWLAACVGVGNLLYGFRSYACLMAGCTGVVVAMSVYQHPSHLFDIAFGRIAGITVGIIVATGVTAFSISADSADELSGRLRRAAGESVALLALLIRPGGQSSLLRREHDLLVELAHIEELTDVAGAGTLRWKQRKRLQRNLIASLLSLLAVGRLTRERLGGFREERECCRRWRDQFAWKLEVVADKLAKSLTVNCTTELAAISAEAAEHLPPFGETLNDILASLQGMLAECQAVTEKQGKLRPRRLIRHRDWRGAGRAAARAGLTLAAVGVTSSVTGWTKGPLMLMALSIMLSIFSAKDHPAFFVGRIFVGAAVGSATAVLCRVVLLPAVVSPFATIAVIAPFVLLGVFCMSQRRTAIAATDATLFYLFVTQPGMSIAVVPIDMALGAVAMVMGVATAWLGYRFLMPINPGIRLDSLMASILRDVESVAGGTSPAAVEKSTARLRHRVIRLIAIAVRHDADNRKLVATGLAALAATDAVRRLQAALASGELPSSKVSVIIETLVSLSRVGIERGDVTLILERVIATLYEISEPASVRIVRDTPGFPVVGEPCW